METTERNVVSLTLHLPSELSEKLIAAAKPEKRSRHAQIIYALEKFFEAAPNGNGKKEKAK